MNEKEKKYYDNKIINLEGCLNDKNRRIRRLERRWITILGFLLSVCLLTSLILLTIVHAIVYSYLPIKNIAYQNENILFTVGHFILVLLSYVGLISVFYLIYYIGIKEKEE
jgi:hypothetical protein